MIILQLSIDRGPMMIKSFNDLAGAGPMLIASSAILTKRPMLSATLCTATVFIPEPVII